MNNDKPEMSVREAGRRGGNAVKAKYEGTDYYSTIGKVGGKRTSAKYGPDFYEAIGKKGGIAKRVPAAVKP